MKPSRKLKKSPRLQKNTARLLPFQHAPSATLSSCYPRSLLWLLHNIRALRYSVSQLLRSPLESLLTMSLLTVAISLPITFCLLLSSAQRLAPIQQLNPSLSIYLDKTLTNNDANQLISQLKQWPAIQKIHYISPQQGLQQLTKALKLSNPLADISQNPLPAVIQIEPTYGLQSTQKLQALSARIATLPGVAQIQADSIWMQRLHYLLNTAQHLISAVMLLFICGIILITTHTLHHSLRALKQETMVLQLIGAPLLMIRGPLLYRGMCLGFVSSLLACTVVTYLLQILQPSITAFAQTYASQFQLSTLTPASLLAVILSCAALGWFGAWVAFFLYQKKQARMAYH